MHQTVVLRGGIADPAAHRDRHAFGGGIEMRQDLDQQIAVDLGERNAEHASEIQKFRGVGAGLDDAMIRLADDQKRAMRLDRAGEVDLFTFAIRKIGGPECGAARGMTCHSILCVV